MPTTNTLRGHPITLTGGRWVFADTGEPTVTTWRSRPCGHCGLPDTTEGNDACLGEIDGAINACCGHGEESEAYVQFSALAAVRGRAALVWASQQSRPRPCPLWQEVTRCPTTSP